MILLTKYRLLVVLQKSVVHEEDERTAESDADVDKDGGDVDAQLAVRALDLGVIEHQVEDVHVRAPAQQPHVHHQRKQYPHFRRSDQHEVLKEIKKVGRVVKYLYSFCHVRNNKISLPSFSPPTLACKTQKIMLIPWRMVMISTFLTLKRLNEDRDINTPSCAKCQDPKKKKKLRRKRYWIECM